MVMHIVATSLQKYYIDMVDMFSSERWKFLVKVGAQFLCTSKQNYFDHPGDLYADIPEMLLAKKLSKKTTRKHVKACGSHSSFLPLHKPPLSLLYVLAQKIGGEVC